MILNTSNERLVCDGLRTKGLNSLDISSIESVIFFIKLERF